MWSCAVKCSDIVKWIDHDMLQKFPSSFSMLLSNLATRKDDVDDEIVSGVVHRIASIYGAFLLVQGNQMNRRFR